VCDTSCGVALNLDLVLDEMKRSFEGPSGGCSLSHGLLGDPPAHYFGEFPLSDLSLVPAVWPATLLMSGCDALAGKTGDCSRVLCSWIWESERVCTDLASIISIRTIHNIKYFLLRPTNLPHLFSLSVKGVEL